MRSISNTQPETETNPEGAVALLVVFLLVVVFVAQSGLLAGTGRKAEMPGPAAVEMQPGTEASQYVGT